MSEATVLIVEDEGILAIGLKKKLEKLGYYVPAIAYSGNEAIDLAAKCRPDMILMDIVLKGEMDGIEAANKIRSTLNIPVIYLTAYSDEDTVKRAMVTEPFGYLVKPYNDRDLQIALEMTLYKQSMEKLRESHHWLKTVLASISDAVIATDIYGHVNFINPSGERLIGWKNNDAVGKTLEEIITIIDGETGVSVNRHINEALSRSSVVASKGFNQLITKDGREVPVDYAASPISDVKGDVMGMVLILKDLTSQREAEIESKIREVAMASSVNAICITDLHGIIKYVNAPFYELWGYKEDDVIGSLATEICQMNGKISKIEASLNKKGKWVGEMEAIRKDGTNFFVKLSANNICDRLGRPTYIVYSFDDITNLKRAKEDLKKYIAKLQKTDVETDEISEDLSRNFRLADESLQRLHAILLEDDTYKDGEVNKYLADTRDSIDKATNLIEELLRSSLPLSFYISLIGLYQLRIEDFDEFKEAQI